MPSYNLTGLSCGRSFETNVVSLFETDTRQECSQDNASEATSRECQECIEDVMWWLARAGVHSVQMSRGRPLGSPHVCAKLFKVAGQVTSSTSRRSEGESEHARGRGRTDSINRNRKPKKKWQSRRDGP